MPEGLQGVGVDEQLGRSIPLDLTFIDSTGNEAALRDFFDGEHPVILTLNYYRCPMLCTLQLNGLVKGLNEVDFDPAEEYRIVTVSIDPDETFDLAALKKTAYLSAIEKEGAADGWSFLVSPPEHDNAKRLADSVGFTYRWNPDRQEWAHDSAIFILSPDGKITRYLYGITFEPDTLRLALVEGGEGKIGTTLDRVILWCFHYDDKTGQYTVAVMNIMRVAGLATAVLLGSVIFILWKREQKRRTTGRSGFKIGDLKLES